MRSMAREEVDVEEMSSVHDLLNVRQLVDHDVEVDARYVGCRVVIHQTCCVDPSSWMTEVQVAAVVVAEVVEEVVAVVLARHQVHATTDLAKWVGVHATM